MKQYIWTATALVSMAALCSIAESRSLEKRQVHDPHHVDLHLDLRDKKKIEAKYGVKNAILGLVFNKINSFIDQKTAWVEQLDKTNIAKNHAHGIYPPKDPIVSLSGIISGVIGDKLQAAGPILTVVTNKLTSGSSAGGHTGFNIGSLLGGLSGGLKAGSAHTGAGAHASVSAYGAAI